MARDRVIGRDNKLPWHIPEELKLFKKTTMGYPMIMGRKTFESLGKPLPGRRHIVVSRNPSYSPAGGERAGSVDEAVQLCRNAEKVFVIGGAEVFLHALPLADTILLTEIDLDVKGDVFFPYFSDTDFQEANREEHPDASIPFTIITYRKISANT